MKRTLLDRMEAVTELESKQRELARLEMRFVKVRDVYQSRRDALREEIRELREARVTVRESRAGVELNAHTQAGRENLDRVRSLLGDLGTATQARLCEMTGINSGTMTWCLRALVEDGTVRETGVRVRNSREVELVATNGRRRVSTARPGS
jgi:hypothetical protein